MNACACKRMLSWRQAAAETPGLRPYILDTTVSHVFDSVQVCCRLILDFNYST
jgi:hypothetical protein